MRRLALLRHLLRTDARLLGRDPMLIFITGYLVLMMLLLRWGLPPLQRWLLEAHGFDFEPYLPLVAAYFAVLVPPLFVGFMIGFLVLDEKEDGTLRARLVTPVPFGLYIAYRVAMPTVLALVLTPMLAFLLGFGSPTWPVVLAIALVNAPAGALSTLFYPVFASDKVQAFALSKAMSTLAILPIAAHFVATPWCYLVGLFPPYWTVRAFQAAQAGEPFVVYLLVGCVANGVAGVLLFRGFYRMAHSG